MGFLLATRVGKEWGRQRQKLGLRRQEKKEGASSSLGFAYASKAWKEWWKAAAEFEFHCIVDFSGWDFMSSSVANVFMAWDRFRVDLQEKPIIWDFFLGLIFRWESYVQFSGHVFLIIHNSFTQHLGRSA